MLRLPRLNSDGVWSVMRKKICKGAIEDVDELAFTYPADELDQPEHINLTIR